MSKYIIAGLGNPCEKYHYNRHNVGFRSLDEIFQKHTFSDWKSKHHALITTGQIAHTDIILVKPQTYMNDSGRAISQIMHYYKIDVTNLLVIFDELDLSLGQFRYKQGGGFAGHNGLKSIAAHIGKEFNRLRLGIGHPGDKRFVSQYVLTDFSKHERTVIDPLLYDIAQHISVYFTESPHNFINVLSQTQKTLHQ